MRAHFRSNFESGVLMFGDKHLRIFSTSMTRKPFLVETVHFRILRAHFRDSESPKLAKIWPKLGTKIQKWALKVENGTFSPKNVFSVEIRRVSFRLSIIWASYLKNGPSYDCLQISKIGQNWPKLAKITKMTVFGLVTPEMVFQARSKYFRVVLGVLRQK